MNTQSISVMEFRKRIGDVLSRVHYTGERFIIERNGKPVAAVICLEDLQRLQSMDDDQEPQKAGLQPLSEADVR